MNMDDVSILELVLGLLFVGGLSYFTWFRYPQFIDFLFPSPQDEFRGCMRMMYANPLTKWSIRLGYAFGLLMFVALFVYKLATMR